MEELSKVRPRAVTTALVTALAVLGVRATQLHIVRQPTASHARAVEVPARPTRGRIVDARGEVLADNVRRWELDANPARLLRHPGATARLAETLGVAEAELDERLRGRGHGVVRVRAYLDAREAEAVRRAALPGVWLSPVEMRRYPHEALTASVVGAMRDVAPDDRPGPYGYRLGDRVGASGIERSWDLTLRGASTLAPTRQGMTLVTHLDLRLQRAAWEALDGARGTAVALDPRDGRVLALVTRDAYDCARRGGRDPACRPDPNRAHAANADLALRGIPLRDPDDLRVAPIWHALDPILAAQARAHGATFDARRRDPQVADAESLRVFGLGRPSGIDLRDELAGAVNPDVDDAPSPPPRAMATPLQVAVAYATVVNGGTVYQPRLVREVRHPDGAIESRTTPVVASHVDLPTGESERTLASLVRWADARRRAPTYAGLPTVGAFGEPFDWFVAVAPADRPRVVVVVMTREPTGPDRGLSPLVGAEPAALHLLRAWHRISSESP